MRPPPAYTRTGLEFAELRDVVKAAARWGLAGVLVLTAYYVFRPAASPGRPLDASTARLDVIRRAQVYVPTDIRHRDFRRAPQARGAFVPHQLVRCDYVQATFDGRSPKFECAVPPDDRLKVKYGADNGEVYAEVAATWLFRTLGFGADLVYPVRVECHGCPAEFDGKPDPLRTVLVDPASIERKFEGASLVTRDGRAGWAWPELDLIDEAAGGAPRAHVDALKLLAAMLQHTDSKPVNQRIVVLPDGRPFMVVQDLGLTFGRANIMNRDRIGSVDYDGWAHTPVWAPGPGCVANIERSFTGTLDHPRISEAGRAMLSGLLEQLSREQIEDLFDVARFAERSRHSVTDWTEAFLHKRAEIRDRRCADRP
jgi:hypothetical protein